MHEQAVSAVRNGGRRCHDEWALTSKHCADAASSSLALLEALSPSFTERMWETSRKFTVTCSRLDIYKRRSGKNRTHHRCCAVCFPQASPSLRRLLAYGTSHVVARRQQARGGVVNIYFQASGLSLVSKKTQPNNPHVLITFLTPRVW